MKETVVKETTLRRSLLAVLGAIALAGTPRVLAQAPSLRPPLLYREEWKQPPYEGELDDEKRKIRRTDEAIANRDLDLKLYGPDVKNLVVAQHEGRHDLWTGLVLSPMAATLRHKEYYVDLTGPARVRWIARTRNLHVIHPMIKLADGTLIAGSHAVETDGDFLSSEVSFGNQRWYVLDPEKLVTTVEYKSPDLSKVDEIGFVDLMPGGGSGLIGCSNLSTFEVYANPVPRGVSR